MTRGCFMSRRGAPRLGVADFHESCAARQPGVHFPQLIGESCLHGAARARPASGKPKNLLDFIQRETKRLSLADEADPLDDLRAVYSIP